MKSDTSHKPQTQAMTTTIAAPIPRPSLTTDPTLAPFLQPAFSPIDYLNSALPLWTPLNTSAASHQPYISTSHTITASTTPQTKTSSLTTTLAETQNLLTSLDAKLTRLSSSLTQLTDDILRSGSRLAYEVEILTANAGSLSEMLRSGAVARFLPDTPKDADNDADGSGHEARGTETETQGQLNRSQKHNINSAVPKPRALETLHTLSLLRTRLTTVIKTFDAALAWPMPPSSLSASTSSALRNNFISVTAPAGTAGSGAGAGASADQDAESKGLAFEAQLRGELAELLEEGPEGLVAAQARVEELRGLCEVWRGTGEERARVRFVEGLGRFVEGGG